MQTETKSNLTGGSLAAETEVDVDVTGFSWNPTGVLSVSFAWGASAVYLKQTGGFGSGVLAESAVNSMSIVSITPGTAKVTVRLRNSHAVTTYYYDNIIVTAVRAP